MARRRAPRGYASPLAQELAADVLDRFVRYARIDTQAVEGRPRGPSSERQLDLSRLLLAERGLGLEDAELTSTATSSRPCRGR